MLCEMRDLLGDNFLYLCYYVDFCFSHLLLSIVLKLSKLFFFKQAGRSSTIKYCCNERIDGLLESE